LQAYSPPLRHFALILSLLHAERLGAEHTPPVGRSRQDLCGREGAPEICCPPLLASTTSSSHNLLPPSLASTTPSTTTPTPLPYRCRIHHAEEGRVAARLLIPPLLSCQRLPSPVRGRRSLLSLPKACGAGASSDIPRRQRVVRGRRRARRRPLRGLIHTLEGGWGER
jgi:hypothetical protein